MIRSQSRYAVVGGVLFVVFLLWLCWPFSSRLTFDNVVKVHAGQTYPEVVAILGKPDDGPELSHETRNVIGYSPEGLRVWARWGVKPGTPGPLTMPIVDVSFANGVVTNIYTSNIKP